MHILINLARIRYMLPFPNEPNNKLKVNNVQLTTHYIASTAYKIVYIILPVSMEIGRAHV